VADDGSSVSVDVAGGNKRAREAAEAYDQAHPGEPIVFAVTDDTKAEVNEESADLSALAVGQEVKVQSKAAKDATQFDARKISVEDEPEED